MAKKLDPMLVDILKKFEIDPHQALWDCHGTWVMYHRYIELVGAKAGVSFQSFQVIESDVANGIATVLCSGEMNGRFEYATGECSPKNNKNAYPLAMAEKRAKDRIILKLVGLHGFVYSEEESDDFKKPQSSAQLKRDDVWPAFEAALNDCRNEGEIEKLKVEYRETVKAQRWPTSWQEAMGDAFAMKSKELKEYEEMTQEEAA